MMFDTRPCLDGIRPAGRKDETVTQSRAAFIGRLGVSTDPEWDLSPWPRIDAGSLDAVKATVETHNRRGPELAEQVDLFFEARGARTEVLSECLIFDVVPANADPESQSFPG